MQPSFATIFVAIFFLAASVCTTMAGSTKYFFANLIPAQEVPGCPQSQGSGSATFTYIDKQLCVYFSYRGLTGPETASHIHGPALVNATSGVIYKFNSSSTNKKECTTLSSTLEGYLLNAKLYTNVHTAACPGGEIRGQIFKTGD